MIIVKSIHAPTFGSAKRFRLGYLASDPTDQRFISIQLLILSEGLLYSIPESINPSPGNLQTGQETIAQFDAISKRLPHPCNVL